MQLNDLNQVSCDMFLSDLLVPDLISQEVFFDCPT